MNTGPGNTARHAPLPWRALLALALLGTLFLYLLARLDAGRDALSEALMFVGDEYGTPVKAISPPRPPFRGGVLLLHGYGGSKEMMQVLARGLAAEGFYTLSVDLPGCGDSRRSFNRKDFMPALQSAYRDLVGRALLNPGRIAVIGHSMGGGLALQLAREHTEVQATVLLSSVPGEVQSDSPRNLLLLTAENDLPRVGQMAVKMMQASFPNESAVGESTRGDFQAGTARRVGEIPGTNHFTILYSEEAGRQVSEWLRQALRLDAASPASLPRPATLLLFLGNSVLLLFPLVTLAVYFAGPQTEAVARSEWNWRKPWGLYAGGCFLGCLGAAILPWRPWIPLHLVDYVATACALAGLMVGTGSLLMGLRVSWDLPPWRRWAPPLLIAAGGFLFVYWNVGITVNDHWLHMSLSGGRWGVFVRVALLLAPLFLVQELVARELQQRRGFWRSWLLQILMNGVLMAALYLPALAPFARLDTFLLVMSLPFLVAFFVVIPAMTAALHCVSRSVLLTAAWSTLVYAWLFTATPFWK